MPTRELAIQVCAAVKSFQRLYSIRCCPVYGGQDREQQLQELSKNGSVHVVVATPGRLLDLVVSFNDF